MIKDTITDHLFRLLYVIRNAACHRALSHYMDECNQNYWILIYNNFLAIAILEWCKLFGTDSEPTHWKTLVDDHNIFRQELLQTIGIDQSDWDTYWENIKNYRKEILAHHKQNPNVTHYPSLDIALESSFHYFTWLVAKLQHLNIYFVPDDLREYYDSFLSQASKFAKVSYISTKEIIERVY